VFVYIITLPSLLLSSVVERKIFFNAHYYEKGTVSGSAQLTFASCVFFSEAFAGEYPYLLRCEAVQLGRRYPIPRSIVQCASSGMKNKLRWRQISACFLSLLFDLQDRGSTLLCDGGKLLPECTSSHPRQSQEPE
jgi:hypothetical protein